MKFLFKLLFLLLFLPLLSIKSLAAKDVFGFQQALPGYRFAFPQDEASHNRFKTEWWYYTGHLKADTGKIFGYELTFFRSATGIFSKASQKNNPWQLNQLYVAHLALTDVKGKHFYTSERLGRNGPGVSGALEDRYRVWIGSWFAEKTSNHYHLKASSFKKGQPSFGLNLRLVPKKPWVVHGKNGVSQKASCQGCASHYYSQTRLETTGELYLNGKTLPVKGLSWMDHEFGSNQLASNQTGWDWFSIQLENHQELMLYRLRLQDGSLEPNSSGTWVLPNGKSQYLKASEVKLTPLSTWKSPHSQGVYPSGWQLDWPQKKLTLTITPILQDQELNLAGGATGVAYWEGACKVSGTKNGLPINGQAYVELTGYAKAFNSKI